MANTTTIRDVVCLGCGCLCDDLAVELSPGQRPIVRPACPLAEQWLTAVDAWRPSPCRIDGSEVSLDAALDRAAKLLGAAHAPLVCGLAGADVNAQRVAVAIAEELRGCIDWTSTPAERAGVETQQAIGGVEASWGEIAQRADLVIFWQCDPAATHPRHFERYGVEPKSHWLPRGKADRRVVCVGDPSWETARQADHAIALAPGQSVEAFARLRAALQAKRLKPPPPGFPAQEFDELAGWVREARYAVVFYDHGLGDRGPAALVELTQLAQQAQEQTRMATASLPGAGNAAGASSVMTWQTGYPMAVSFAAGQPEYGPGEFHADVLLAAGDVDAALVVADQGVDRLPEAARKQLGAIPTVLLTSREIPVVEAAVEISVAPLGAAPGGSVFRGDGVVLPIDNRLHGGKEGVGPTHHDVLKRLHQRIAALRTPAASGSAFAP